MNTFLYKANELHKNKYTYPNIGEEYCNYKTKITIKCNIHGEKQQTPDNHLRGHGCNDCAKLQRGLSRRFTNDEFLKKATDIHGDTYDYSDVKYIKWDEYVTIKCLDHGPFTQSPNNHLQGKGCKKCSIKTNSDKQRKTLEEFIEESRAKHGDKFDYSEVSYINTNTHVKIVCPIHNKFEQTPIDHIQSIFGCKKCADTNNGLLGRSNTDEFIKKSIIVHRDTYDYSEVKYEKNTTDVIIKCKIHGAFLQHPCVHLRGNGCQKCGIQKSANAKRYILEEFIQKAIDIHGLLYNYDSVNYISSHIKVIINCHLHGSFSQVPNSHLSGNGCPSCSYDTAGDKLRKTYDEFVNDARDIHGQKYDYSSVIYKNTNTSIKIICPIHSEFLQTPSTHLSGGGCSKCVGRISKISQEWLNLISLNSLNIIFEHRIPNTRYFADAYDPDTNTIYEFHGDYWHGNPVLYNSNILNKTTKCTMGKLYQKTVEKKIKCIELGYKYIELWEYNWKNFKKIIRMIQLRFIKRKYNI